jgi:hypothetical protein
MPTCVPADGPEPGALARVVQRVLDSPTGSVAHFVERQVADDRQHVTVRHGVLRVDRRSLVPGLRRLDEDRRELANGGMLKDDERLRAEVEELLARAEAADAADDAAEGAYNPDEEKPATTEPPTATEPRPSGAKVPAASATKASSPNATPSAATGPAGLQTPRT